MPKCETDLSKGAKALLRRLVNGYSPGYEGRFPTHRYIEELESVGFMVQIENPLHEPKNCFPLNEKEFMTLAKKYGFTPDTNPPSKKRGDAK